MAAPHVIQQVLKALGQGLTTAVQRQLQRLGIEREEVAGRGGVYKLGHREADALTRFGVGLDGVRHLVERAAVEQVELREELRHRAGLPGVGGKAAVLRLGQLAAAEAAFQSDEACFR